MIDELRERYKLKVGFSDHSGDIFACLAAAALGATILEFHVVFDKRLFGPDSKSSLEIDQVKTLVKGVRQVETAIRNPIDKSDNNQFNEVKSMFEKSLAANKALPEGHILSRNDLETKKPKGHGIEASRFQEILGKKLVRELQQWDFINWEDLN